MRRQKPPPSGEERGAATRAALLRAALEQFGAHGFEATSTRAIAEAAHANLASIAYHFGGKDGLRLACADHVVSTIGGTLGAAIGALDAAALSPAAAAAALQSAVAAMVDILVMRDEAQAIARFVLREQFEPSPAFERIYAAAFAPMHRQICALWAAATGAEAESEAAKLATLALLGQVLYFRLARPVVLRRLQWSGVGPAEAEKIRRAVRAHLEAAIHAARSAAP